MEENLDTMNLVDLRLTRPLPPPSVHGSNAGDKGGVKPPYPYTNTSTNAASSSSSSSPSTSPNINTNMKIEQSEEIQLTPEQIRHKRADAGAEMFPLSPPGDGMGNSASPSPSKKTKKLASQAERDAVEKARHDKGVYSIMYSIYCILMYICMYVCMYVLIHTYMHTYTHSYIYIYTNTYSYIHTYIHTKNKKDSVQCCQIFVKTEYLKVDSYDLSI